MPISAFVASNIHGEAGVEQALRRLGHAEFEIDDWARKFQIQDARAASAGPGHYAIC